MLALKNVRLWLHTKPLTVLEFYFVARILSDILTFHLLFLHVFHSLSSLIYHIYIHIPVYMFLNFIGYVRDPSTDNTFSGLTN